MDELIGRISEELPPAGAYHALETLLGTFDSILESSGDQSCRTIAKDSLQGKLNATCFEVLRTAGFEETDGQLCLPSGADLEALSQARDILECCLLSCEPQEARPQVPTAAQPAEHPEEAAAVVGSDELTQEAVERISARCRERGELFTDEEFPARPQSLYMNEADACSWECERCTFRNELPPVPQLASSQAERQRQELEFRQRVRCGMCDSPATYRVYVHFFGRPTQWLRPGAQCGICEGKYGHLRGGRDMVLKMCSHFLRDTASQMTIGAPWKLIRGEARAEDVVQGGLGNCWFAGALSVVTRFPELIDHLFITKEYNPTGAYAVRLCLAGVWRSILVDDLLPTSQLFAGYMDGVPEVRGTHVYYSRGGCPCYLQSDRRQLWVPLLEKAAAKMFGCYAGLIGGTFGEALSLFTGCPVEQLRISWPDQVRVKRALQRQARVEAREKLRQAGKDPDLVELDDGEEEVDDEELQWSKLVSANEHGYLMGMGCASEECGRSQQEIVAAGLQAPHAFAILDVREVAVGDSIARLAKLRNPLGERSERTWKGAWGRDSNRWTHELKVQLGVVNQAGLPLEEGMGTFWMAFDDVKRFFATVEVCRLHPGWHRSHVRAELVGADGPGQAFELEVPEKTQVDLALWQDKGSRREGDVRLADLANADLGLAVLRVSGTDPDGQPEYELIEYFKRTLKDSVSGELILEGGSVYRLVPMSFGYMQAPFPRGTVLTVHSARSVSARAVPASWRDLALASLEGCRRHGRRRPLEGAPSAVATWTLLEEGGTIYAAENWLDEPVCVKVDASKSSGCSSSRGSLEAAVVVPPRSRQVLMILSFEPGRMGGRLLVEGQALPADAAVEAPSEGLHSLAPLPRGAQPPEASAAIQAPAALLSGQDGGSPPPAARSDAPAPAPNAPADEAERGRRLEPTENDDRPVATDSSPESRAGQTAAAPGNGDSSPDSRTAPSAKVNLQVRIKELFKKYQEAGMVPNEAAAQAVRDAQREVGIA